MTNLFKRVAGYEYECIIKNDDMPYLLNKLWEADGQIIRTPVYSYNPPTYFGPVLDRLHGADKRGIKAVPGAV